MRPQDRTPALSRLRNAIPRGRTPRTSRRRCTRARGHTPCPEVKRRVRDQSPCTPPRCTGSRRPPARPGGMVPTSARPECTRAGGSLRERHLPWGTAGPGLRAESGPNDRRRATIRRTRQRRERRRRAAGTSQARSRARSQRGSRSVHDSVGAAWPQDTPGRFPCGLGRAGEGWSGGCVYCEHRRHNGGAGRRVQEPCDPLCLARFEEILVRSVGSA